MNCQWRKTDELHSQSGWPIYRCERPGCTNRAHSPTDKIHATCRRGQSGWGDWLARMLERWGITKTKGCGCTGRQAAMNRAGWWLAPLIRRVGRAIKRDFIG